MKKIYSFIFAGILLTQICFAAGNSKITLNDGTTIFGKVVGMSDGIYTIHTETMGDIKVDSEKVLEISSNTSKNQSNINILDGNNKKSSNYPSYNNGNSNSSSKSNNYAAQQENVNTKVQTMMMNEDFLDNLINLGNTSEMQSVLNDPEIMEAIQNGDYDFLMNNSKMGDLMNSSGIQDILGDMQ